ncbi:short-chain dehydrogenase [Staphylococcus rostri]|uniref:Short-chain dehydrogenase n=2 Tax=Staphylococcus rostri TaxID=522262 RepID=A0A2K3YJ20_9STAP|nr:short-chain dehydrogenase [Staphylococcus rostri]
MDMYSKHYLVTGGTSGIGLELVKLLHRKGHQLTLLIRDIGKAQLKFPENSFPNINFVMCDLNDKDAIQNLFVQFRDKGTKFDGFIHSAGIGYFKSLDAHTPDEVLTTYQLNTIHFALLLNTIKPYLNAQPQIVAMSSMSGLATQPNAAHYAASKAGLNHILNALRFEEPSYHVLNVLLGPVKTPFHDHSDPEGKYKKKLALFMLHPQKVVQSIVQAMDSKKNELYAPKWMACLLKIYQIAPRFIEKLAKPLFMSKMK